MHAMVLAAPGAPLRFELRQDPVPGAGDVRVMVSACAVCRTDLHVVDGELLGIAYPIVPGHEVVGRIDALGPGVTARRIGERVGSDGTEFFKIAAQADIKTHTTAFPLQQANEVLAKLCAGQITGAAVLQP